MKPFELAPLPYAYDYLEPVIDAETMKLHHDKHHQAYVNNLNAAIAKYPDLAYGCVDCILGDIANVPEDIRQAVINNGGGHKNHTMFWDIMTKPDTSKLQGPLKDAIDADLGGYDAFVESFSQAAATRFGSGWAWLVVNKDGKLEVTSTANQDNPLLEGKTAILCLDVWNIHITCITKIVAQIILRNSSVLSTGMQSLKTTKKHCNLIINKMIVNE